MLGLDVSVTGLATLARQLSVALPVTGLLSDWRFEEGSGDIVADQTGNHGIDLTLAANPNTAWQSHGLSANNGAVQTLVIAGVRTIAMLYRTNTGTGGFHHSGPIATNKGILGSAANGATLQLTDTIHIAKGSGVAKAYRRDDTGSGAFTLNTGGWQVVFRELATSAAGYLTFGGRGGTTTNRNASFDLGWAGVYDRALDDSDRSSIFNFCRSLLRARGGDNYVAFADCPTQADALILWGQSNADGRALIADLSAPDQVRTYSEAFILQNEFLSTTTSFAALDLGGNHCDGGASYFGPEVIWANLRQDSPTGRDLYVEKTARGSAFMAPSSDANVATGASWSEGELETNAGWWRSALKNHYAAISDALEAGIGLNWRGVVWWQGEQDALYTSTADAHLAELTALIASFDVHTGFESVPWVIVQTKQTPPPDAAAEATVRAAQASVAEAMGARATLVDAGGYPVGGDGVHLTATGMAGIAGSLYATFF